MEGNREKEHLLALKVMRLTKPTLMPFHPIISDARDVPYTLTQDQNEADIAKPKDLEYFGVSDLLTLPQNFGNIFLGETFSSYISVHNDSNQSCSDILLKADLQTSSQRLLLTGVNSQPVTHLKPNESIDDVIQHEVKELGTHILVCAVSYSTEAGEKMAFRKFFKFQVLKPLDVKTKFYNAESDDVYLEVQIQNITPGPVYMEHVRLDPSNLYKSEELNSLEKKQGPGNVFGKVDYLNPMDTRQYLYCLAPKPEMYQENKVLKGVTNIGKLDIVWKTNLGEKGRLQTSQLLRVAPGYGDIRVTVEKMPDSVPLEKTFDVTLRITNCCERDMELTMVLQNDLNSGLMWCGLSGQKLGTLPQNEHMDLSLNLITTVPGLQTISGLRLTDNFLKRTYEHDEIAQVFVYNDPES
ncbi:trafficking protein particle complex subunit 13-like isoform X2 [Ruditapes philippinarum]|uniref:trafficking protein particle complex subunit 13-like isoform X2 n=1 Tax=Ruditapes philippinarum TaxID=129788 RepID=UPI00295B868A|nr:trafficking protein particle complex subunit 13-like isoform X2 [Ruditapes philippinarum]